MGNAPFNKPHKKVCNIATLYPQYFQVVVPANAGINSIKDLKGKAVATQPRGNTAEIITQHILKVNGLSYNDVKPSFISLHRRRRADEGQQRPGLHARHHDPVRRRDGPRLGARHQAARPLRQLDAMKKINPGYTLVTVPKGTYPKQDQDVKVIGYATHIVASCELPEDRVYAMTKAMADNVSSMAATNKAMERLTPQDMAEDIGVPFHPGAAKFYKEARRRREDRCERRLSRTHGRREPPSSLRARAGRAS